MNYLDQIAKSRRAIEQVARRLGQLSSAFGLTGNTQMMEDLYELCLELDEQSKVIGTAVSQELDHNLKIARDGSRAILGAALAGVALGKQS